MKSFVRSLFACGVIIVAVSSLSFAQWQNIGPYGGLTSVIAGNDSVLILGTPDRGIFRSTDHASTWTIAINLLSSSRVIALMVDGPNILAGTDAKGILWSSDYGASWQQASNGQAYPGGQWANSTTYSFALLGNKYFAGTVNGISASTDGGRTWTLRNNDSLDIGPQIIAAGPNLYANGCKRYSSEKIEFGMFRSVDTGVTWQFFDKRNISFPGYSYYDGYMPSFGSLAVKDALIFASGSTRGLCSSTDGGISWTLFGLPFLENNVSCLSFVRDTIFVGIDTMGVYMSGDHGATWVQRNTGLTSKRISSFLAVGSDLYTTTMGGGVHRSTDRGMTWRDVNANLTVAPIWSMATIGKSVFASTNGIIFRSTDEGKSWKSISDNLPESGAIWLLAHGQNLFAGGVGIYKTTDEGLHWTNLTLPLNAFYLENTYQINTLCANGPDIYAGLNSGLIRSTDDGLTWSFMDSGKNIRSLISLDNYLFADVFYYHSPENPTSGTDSLLRSSDNGATWMEIAMGLLKPLYHISFAEAGGYLFLGGTFGISYLSGLYATSDDGLSWQSANHGVPSYGAVTSMTSDGAILFATASDTPLVISTDFGANWTRLNGGASPRYVRYLLAADTTLFAGTYEDGILGCSIADLVRGQIHQSYHTGWNLVSVPVAVPDFGRRAVFSNCMSDAYAFEGSYQPHNVLKNGLGYWLKFSYDQPVTMAGTQCDPETIAVSQGWNLIGSIGIAVPVSKIISDPAGIEISGAFGYNNGYDPTDTIWPGMGYWVKTSQAGKLILSASGARAAARIRIVRGNELPPPPPDQAVVKNRVPTVYTLDQNYPNPFNPTTTIRYQLPFDSRVKLSVYNLLGQVVRTLIDGTESAGYKQVGLDGAALSSGIYFYRLDATVAADPSKNFTNIKKMLLLK